MVSARGDLGKRGCASVSEAIRRDGFSFALDNGAWTAYQRDEVFDVDAFRYALDELGDSADFVVAPDIVEGGVSSLKMSVGWLPELTGRCNLTLIAVQDGIVPDDIRPLLQGNIGVFVGGSTAWKIHSMPQWGRLKAETGCYLHVGRVNSRRRIRMCGIAGADSFDGSGVSRFASEVGYLSAEVQQQCLILV